MDLNSKLKTLGHLIWQLRIQLCINLQLYFRVQLMEILIESKLSMIRLIPILDAQHLLLELQQSPWKAS
jgi:hypothetical protein